MSNLSRIQLQTSFDGIKKLVAIGKIALFASLAFHTSNSLLAQSQDKCEAVEIENSPLQAEPSCYDFGLLLEGQKPTTTFKIRNLASELIFITKIEISCNCLKVGLPSKMSLKPGETTELRVTFDTTNNLGTHSKTVDIHTTDKIATPYQSTRITLIADVRKFLDPRKRRR
jgi:hypothetical protein